MPDQPDELPETDERRELTAEERMGQLVLADVIGVVNEETGESQTLWARPHDELVALGAGTRAIYFAVETEEDISYYREIVDKLKNQDPPQTSEPITRNL